MDNADSLSAPFAIVRFPTGLGIIRRCWAIFNSKGEIEASYYPNKDLVKLLNSKGNFIPNKDWCNGEGNPWPILQHIRNSRK